MSATPIRQYDEYGTEKILTFFNKVVYTFDLKDAIDKGFLVPYDYYPIPIEMTNQEFDEYIELTKKIGKAYAIDDELISDAALMLAIKRARLQNNSISKLKWIKEEITTAENIEYTIFYVGDKIFDEAKKILGYEKKIPIHEFTHRQDMKERKSLLEQFEEKKIKALVAMKCLDEGVDIPPTRKAYLLASASVQREFVQRRGRLLRTSPGKEKAIIIDLISFPPENFFQIHRDSKYNAIRAAIKRELVRVQEFASLATNKFQALLEIHKAIDKYL